MICERTLKGFCREDISLIENYEQAIADDSQMWDCHHRKETDEGLSKKELIKMGIYWHRPANELIFLTRAEHNRIHNEGKQGKNKGKKIPAISIAKKGKKIPAISIALKGNKNLSAAMKGKPLTKYKWLTPDGEIKIMSATNAKRHHPDWVRIEPVTP